MMTSNEMAARMKAGAVPTFESARLKTSQALSGPLSNFSEFGCESPQDCSDQLTIRAKDAASMEESNDQIHQSKLLLRYMSAPCS